MMSDQAKEEIYQRYQARMSDMAQAMNPEKVMRKLFDYMERGDGFV